MKIISVYSLLLASVLTMNSQANEVDSAMRSVSYTLTPSQLSIAGFKPGQAAFMKVILCSGCEAQQLPLADNAQLYKDQKSLTDQDFVSQFYKKDYQLIRLGINRDQKNISYINLASDYGEEPESEQKNAGE